TIKALATQRRGSQARRPTSASTGRSVTAPWRSSTPPRGRTSWAAPRACVSTRCTLAGCVCTARCLPTCCGPRSSSPPPTTSPSWRLRSTRPPRPVSSPPSSRQGWAPGWRSPRSRTSSPSHPDPWAQLRVQGCRPHTIPKPHVWPGAGSHPGEGQGHCVLHHLQTSPLNSGRHTPW
uniref:Uncharacterized protein n=1 Tax=Urocitellus parryii TaxID=9999 RepID=A0A8D2HY11_UROPR